MTIISNTTVNWRLSPRIITIPNTETEITVEDLQDTLLDLEDDETDGILWPHLRNTSGGEELGGEVTVGWTMELQDAQIAFEPRTTSKSEGTITTPNAVGTTLIDSGADFVSDGVTTGATIINLTDKSVSSVIEVIDLNTLSCYPLADGTDNQFDNGDAYKVWNEVQCEITGGNVVAVDSGGSPISAIKPTFGTQILQTSASSATLQELTAIQYSSFNGGVTIDVINGCVGTEFPCGTAEQPVDNLTDAQTIAEERGFRTLYIVGDITFGASEDLDGYIIYGETRHHTTLTFTNGCSTEGTEIHEATIQGTLSGAVEIKDACLLDIVGLDGEIFNALMKGTITLAGTNGVQFIDCVDGLPGLGVPTINVGSGRSLGMWNYTGGLKLQNKSGDDSVSVNMISARLILDSSVTNGTILVKGVGLIQDESDGATVDITGLVQAKKLLSTSKFLGLK